MNRYDQLFTDLNAKREGAFIPFVTIGDPDIETSHKIIETLIEAGADALELSIPFSDPLADGPTIQSANLRALASQVTPQKCFALIHKIRQEYSEIPMGLLVYANLVFTNGIDNFYAQCQQAGVDSVLIADVPLEEADPYIHSAQKHGVAPVFICPPDADEALVQVLAEKTRAYTYLLSRAGVTGTDKDLRASNQHTRLTHLLKKYQAAPAVQGFGISTPEQVTSALSAGAAGAISGSAVVQIIEKNLHNVPDMLEKLTTFVQEMKAASR